MATKAKPKDSKTPSENGAFASENGELSQKQEVDKANRAMEKAWDLIYQRRNKAD